MFRHGTAAHGVERTVALSVWTGCCALLLYLPFRSQRFDANGIIEALAVDAGGARLWSPNHLLYRPLAAAVDAGLRALGYGGRSMAVLQAISALCGALTVGLASFIGARLGRDHRAAALAAALLATAWAQWSFSTDATYMTLAAACAAAAIAWVLTTDGSLRSACGGGMLVALAMLSWQANVFLLVPLAPLWFHHETRRPLASAVLVGTAGALVLVVYTAAAGLAGQGGGVRGVVTWASSYGGGVTLPMWGAWSAARFSTAAQAWLSSVLPVWEGLGLRALVRGEVQADKVLRQFALLALLGLIGLSADLARRALRRGALRARRLAWLIAGVAGYLPFIVWWDPGAPKWFLVPNVFVAGAAAIIWAGASLMSRALLALAIVVIATANFTATILPAHVGVSPYEALGRCVAAQLGPRDLMLITDWGWYEHAQYWHGMPGTALRLIDARPSEEKLALISERLSGTHQDGGRVYGMATDRGAPERVAWLYALTQLRPEDFDRFIPRAAFTCGETPFVELTGAPPQQIPSPLVGPPS